MQDYSPKSELYETDLINSNKDDIDFNCSRCSTRVDYNLANLWINFVDSTETTYR